MPRPKNTDTRRREIADGLLKAMASRGYEGASMSAVAEAAGVTAGVIHYHFKTKQEILLVALEQLRAAHLQAVEAHCASVPAGSKRLAAFIEHHLGLGHGNSEQLATWIIVGAEAVKQPQVAEAYGNVWRDLQSILLDIIREGTRQGDFHTRAPEEVAAAILATIQGYFSISAAARDVIPRGSAARNAVLMAQALLQSATHHVASKETHD